MRGSLRFCTTYMKSPTDCLNIANPPILRIVPHFLKSFCALAHCLSLTGFFAYRQATYAASVAT